MKSVEGRAVTSSSATGASERRKSGGQVKNVNMPVVAKGGGKNGK